MFTFDQFSLGCLLDCVSISCLMGFRECRGKLKETWFWVWFFSHNGCKQFTWPESNIRIWLSWESVFWKNKNSMSINQLKFQNFGFFFFSFPTFSHKPNRMNEVFSLIWRSLRAFLILFLCLSSWRRQGCCWKGKSKQEVILENRSIAFELVGSIST